MTLGVSMIKLTNIHTAPYGLYDEAGKLHMLVPGQTKSLVLSRATLAIVTGGSFFKVEPGHDKDSVTIEGLAPEEIYSGPLLDELQEAVKEDEHKADSLAQLREDAAALGVKVDSRWGVKRLQSEIDKALASDAVPTSDSDPA